MHNVIDYHLQSTVLMVVPFVFACFYFVRNRYGWPASLLMLSSGLSSMWVWIYRDNRYVTINPYDQMALRYFAADSLLKTLLVVIPLMIFLERRRFIYRGALIFLSFAYIIIDSLSIMCQAVFSTCMKTNECGGIGINPSISVSLMVCLLPLVVFSLGTAWFVIALTLVAVILSKSSIAIGLFAVYLTQHILNEYEGKIKYVVVLIMNTAIFSLGGLILGPELTNSSDRFKIWKFMMERWDNALNIPTGTGFGTYHVFSVNLQHYGNISPGYHWNWMHNDWLQFLFECGAVGFLLLLATYLHAFIRMFNKHDYQMSCSILLYGIFMFLNPALHLPIPMFFGAMIFLYALNRDVYNEGMHHHNL